MGMADRLSSRVTNMLARGRTSDTNNARPHRPQPTSPNPTADPMSGASRLHRGRSATSEVGNASVIGNTGGGGARDLETDDAIGTALLTKLGGKGGGR